MINIALLCISSMRHLRCKSLPKFYELKLCFFNFLNVSNTFQTLIHGHGRAKEEGKVEKNKLFSLLLMNL